MLAKVFNLVSAAYVPNLVFLIHRVQYFRL